MSSKRVQGQIEVVSGAMLRLRFLLGSRAVFLMVVFVLFCMYALLLSCLVAPSVVLPFGTLETLLLSVLQRAVAIVR